MSQAYRCFVTGRVQGVGFRYSTQKRAEQLGLHGWVRNLPDGRVEALICGPAEALDEMLAWLQQGPSLARVDKLESQAADAQREVGFRCLSTPVDYP